MLSAPLVLSLLSLLPFSQAQNETDQPTICLVEDFDFELLVPLGEAIYSGGDIGPILGAAKEIKSGDMASFSLAFHKLANDTKAQALDPELAYDLINVRETNFAASSYFRRADFYLHGNWEDPRINQLWDEQLETFDKGMQALPIPGQRLLIPADGFDVHAIWFPVSTCNSTMHPTLLAGNGYDGPQEDLYHTIVVPALQRGWNVLTYEGPGRPVVRRQQNIGFIHDWERVVTPLVDHLLDTQAAVVDPDRLALFGYSFGGYLAARAAAFEPRLSAVLLDGGIWSTFDSFISGLGPDGRALFESGDKEAFDNQIQVILNDTNTPVTLRWGIEQGLWSFNTKSGFDFLQLTKQFTLEGIADKITIPTWIADAQYEGFFEGQASLVKEALGEKATYHRFNGTAGYHCQVGALSELNRVMHAWLNRTLG